jgi:hypothetical protein
MSYSAPTPPDVKTHVGAELEKPPLRLSVHGWLFRTRNSALCGVPSTWHRPTTRQPGAALDGTATCTVRLCPRAGLW